MRKQERQMDEIEKLISLLRTDINGMKREINGDMNALRAELLDFKQQYGKDEQVRDKIVR